MEKLIEQIVDYSLLSYNWDGEGGFTANPSSQLLALQFLLQLKRDNLQMPYGTGLNSNGMVSLYWNTTNMIMECVFLDNNIVSYFAKDLLSKTQIKGSFYTSGNYIHDDLVNLLVW